jgi:hypothetical protein
MNEIINLIKGLFNSYGGEAVVIIILIIILTNLIKKPLIALATRIAKEKKIDKSIVTKYITFIPIGISFLLVFIFSLVQVKGNFNSINWGELATTSSLYGALSIALYECIKIQLKAYASKKISELDIKELKEETQEEIKNDIPLLTSQEVKEEVRIQEGELK